MRKARMRTLHAASDRPLFMQISFPIGSARCRSKRKNKSEAPVFWHFASQPAALLLLCWLAALLLLCWFAALLLLCWLAALLLLCWRQAELLVHPQKIRVAVQADNLAAADAIHIAAAQFDFAACWLKVAFRRVQNAAIRPATDELNRDLIIGNDAVRGLDAPV